jgi:hypothetical protein
MRGLMKTKIRLTYSKNTLESIDCLYALNGIVLQL